MQTGPVEPFHGVGGELREAIEELRDVIMAAEDRFTQEFSGLQARVPSFTYEDRRGETETSSFAVAFIEFDGQCLRYVPVERPLRIQPRWVKSELCGPCSKRVKKRHAEECVPFEGRTDILSLDETWPLKECVHAFESLHKALKQERLRVDQERRERERERLWMENATEADLEGIHKVCNDLHVWLDKIRPD